MCESSHCSSHEIIAQVDTWPYYEDDPTAYKQFLRDCFSFMIDGIAKPSIDEEKYLITLHCADEFDARTKAVEEALLIGHHANAYPSLRVWQNERYPVYAADRQHIFNVDGSGVDVIGARSFAVYLTAWTNTSEGRKYWVQRRGWNKTLLPESNQGAPAYTHHTQYVYEIELDEDYTLSGSTEEVAEFNS
ncbi:hypothetical protein BKA65DRAFT_544386 [Rhexocercosporidium sp. MPI-PUGE-AT-0058]|nr:hypothetical protein BKA65DRAFT_544386 [Rhexocercosporidium sp. MPI-PUGE-AT-0058]